MAKESSPPALPPGPFGERGELTHYLSPCASPLFRVDPLVCGIFICQIIYSLLYGGLVFSGEVQHEVCGRGNSSH